MRAFNLETCARPNILKLEPYRCAREKKRRWRTTADVRAKSDYADDGTNVLLDANENAYGPGLLLSSDGTLANGDSKGLSSSSSSSKPPNGTTTAPRSAESSVNLLGLNRYPDPHQIELKQLFCDLRNSANGSNGTATTTTTHSTQPLTPANVFVGVGSDEAIDAILRAFCAPGRDKMLTCPPTYGMYSVSASVNDVGIVKVPLDTNPSSSSLSSSSSSSSREAFALRPDAICEALSADPSIKAVYVCSPGNPTGTLVGKEAVRRILEHPTWNGVVVVDEAYVDFAADVAADSLATWVPEWPNLVVMQTLSKAFGLAGVRIGVAFADPAIARLLNSMKAPYSISSPSSALATYALQKESLAVMRDNMRRIVDQRDRLVRELPAIRGVSRIRGGTDANFLLVEMLRPGVDEPSNEVALAVYERLAENKGVVVRFRGKEEGCMGCLRITVGTEQEVDRFLKDLTVVLNDIFQGIKSSSIRQVDTRQEEKDEVKASAVVA